MRDGVFAVFGVAMLTVTFAPRPPHAATQQKTVFTVQAAWLAERESALGDWESVTPPLREGDELQLTVRASEDACVYVLTEMGTPLFPPPGAPPSRACLRAGWPYAIPGPHQTWRLDGGAHDRIFLVASRHPLADPADQLGHRTPAQAAPDLPLPLRDGRVGAARVHVLSEDGVIVDHYDAR